MARNSGKIARAKPELRTKITQRLLNIDRTHQGRQKELLKGHAIEAFDEYFEETENQPEILEFVKKQLKSKSPKTKKLAREFLKKWDSEQATMPDTTHPVMAAMTQYRHRVRDSR